MSILVSWRRPVRSVPRCKVVPLRGALLRQAARSVSLFEYLAIAYSLVLSFAAVRLVSGLSHALDANRRYWIHVGYVCLGLFSALALFWAHWSTRDLNWTFLTFTVNLAGPGMVYFLSCTIVPDRPDSVESWQDYFFSVRRRYFGGLCVWAGLMVANTTLLLEMPLVHPSRIIQIGLACLGVAGLASGSPRGHAAILGLGLLIVVAVAFIVGQPGALAS